MPSLSPSAKPISLAVAYYIGRQERLTGAPIDLFNLLIPLPSIDRTAIHPVESTISRQTLESNGVRAPRYLTIGQRVMSGAHRAQQIASNKLDSACTVRSN